jgi:hypothetical protein
MPTYHQVTVKGQQPVTLIGFQTDSQQSGGAPIDKGAECTGRFVGVHGIADDQGVFPPVMGNGVEGNGNNGGSGVSGQGAQPTVEATAAGPGVTGVGGGAQANSSVNEQDQPIFPPIPGAPGVIGQGGPANALLATVTTGLGNLPPPTVPSAAPAGSGVTGLGGRATEMPHGNRPPAGAAAGPGVVGHGGGAFGNQAAGSGIVGVSGDTPISPAIAGYGGVFTSGAQAQVHLVPAQPAAGAQQAPLPGPGQAQAGDLFVRSHSDAHAELWFCSSPTPTTPHAPVVWNLVQFSESRGPGV